MTGLALATGLPFKGAAVDPLLAAGPVFAIRASDSITGEQFAVNKGSGGSALNAQYGSTTSVDTNDPRLLEFKGVPYLYLPGSSSNFCSSPKIAAYTPTASLDVRAAISLDTLAGTHAIVANYTAAATDRSWLFMYTGANISLYLSTDGATATQLTSTVAPTTVADSLFLVRATWTASPAEVKFFQKVSTESRAGVDLASDTGWTQLGTTITASVPSSALASSTSNLTIGTQSSINMLLGKIYSIHVRADGSTVFNSDFTKNTNQSSFVESSSNAATVTISRATSGTRSVVVTQSCWLLGTDDYFELPDNVNLDFGVSPNFSVVATFRQWNQIGIGVLINKNYTGTPYWLFRTAGNTPALGAALVLNDVTNTATGFSGADRSAGNIYSVGIIVNGSVSNVTVGRSSSNTNITSTAAVTATLSNNGITRIGAAASGGGGFVDAELLSIALYRRALSIAEWNAIQNYYRGAA